MSEKWLDILYGDGADIGSPLVGYGQFQLARTF